MKIFYLLPLLVAASYASPVPVEEKSYWIGRVNNGFTREPANDFTKLLYQAHLDAREELDKCNNYTMLDTLIRRDEVILTLNCDGEILFAEGTMGQVKRRDDLELSPPALDDGNFSDASMFQDKVFPWFETVKGDGCTVDYLSCLVKADKELYIFEFTCPESCADGSKTYKFYDFSMTNGENSITRVADKPSLEGSMKTCTKEKKDALLLTGTNTKLILEDAGLDASNLNALTVVTGHFLELETSTRYCMQVEDPKGNQASISITQFELEGTVPFIATPTFDTLDLCLDYLRKVSCQFMDRCTYGF